MIDGCVHNMRVLGQLDGIEEREGDRLEIGYFHVRHALDRLRLA